MRILTTGTGVIGTIYSRQLSCAGHETAHLVRAGKKRFFDEYGIAMRCLDLRGRKPVETGAVYRPLITETLSRHDNYDLVIVSVNSHQLREIVPLLHECPERADIMLLQNMRPGDVEFLDQSLGRGRYMIGYPFMAGGGRDDQGIDAVIFGGPLVHTKLGEPGGAITPRLRKIARALREAGMRPRITRHIISYVRAHYVWAAASVGACLKAGSFKAFASDLKIICESYLAIREGFRALRAQGIEPVRVSPNWLYYLPLAILSRFTRMMYSNEGMRRMFEGHIAHSPQEMAVMYHDVLREGSDAGINMPVYEGFREYIDRYCDARGLTV